MNIYGIALVTGVGEFTKIPAFSHYRDYQVGNFAEDGQLFASHAHNLEKSEICPLDTDISDAYYVLAMLNVRINQSMG